MWSSVIATVRAAAIPLALVPTSGAALASDSLPVVHSYLAARDPGDNPGDNAVCNRKPFLCHGTSMFRNDSEKFPYQAKCYDALGFYTQLGLMQPNEFNN